MAPVAIVAAPVKLRTRVVVMKYCLAPRWVRTQCAAGPLSPRSLLAAFLVAAVAVLSACGGGGDFGAQPPADPPPVVEPAPPPPPPAAPVDTVAPASVAYDTPQPLYVRSEAITTNSAQVTGGPARAFSVAPALPAGLSLDAATGAITGTPAAIQSQATYTVTASNAAGSASTQLRITVTARGSWVATAPILPGRHYFSATKLPNGRVLVAGGFTAAGVTNAAALYDPAAGTWTPAAPMLVARNDHTATLLPDGRVLVAGGQPAALGGATLTAEIYDPVANTWTATGSMAQGRIRHSATLLANGQVLVIGGYDRPAGATTFTDTAERYDPATGTWTALANRLSVPRTQHAAELLPDGVTVLVAAGVNGMGFVTSAELLRADDTAPPTVMAAVGGTGNVAQSVRLADGSVLVTSDGTTTAWRFHPATSTWTTSTAHASRTLPTMTRLADGRVLLAGGSNLDTVEIYNPDVNVWTTATSMPLVRRAGAAALLDDGNVLVIGGFNGGGEIDTVDIYRP